MNQTLKNRSALGLPHQAASTDIFAEKSNAPNFLLRFWNSPGGGQVEHSDIMIEAHPLAVLTSPHMYETFSGQYDELWELLIARSDQCVYSYG